MPFFNVDSLCDVYINIGEDKLCDTCKQYPRITKRFDDVFEQNLTLSCPEVAKILVSYDGTFDFCFGEYEDNYNIISSTKNDELYNSLVMGRGLSVDIMQLREIPLWKRAYLCIHIADKIQNLIDLKQWNNIKEDVEPFQNDVYLYDYFEKLEIFPSNKVLKLEQYVFLLKTLKKFDIKCVKFLEYVNEAIEFFNGHDPLLIVELLAEVIMSFEKLYKEKDFIYENYMVYHLFRYYMTSYKKGNLYQYIVMMLEGYSLMKLFAMVRWYNNGNQISDKEQVEILYSYSRSFEHIKGDFDIFYKLIKDEGYDTKPYLATLIR